MNIFFKMKNFATCAMFCRRLLELNPGAKVCACTAVNHCCSCLIAGQHCRHSRVVDTCGLVSGAGQLSHERTLSADVMAMLLRTADGAAGEAGARGVREEPQRCDQAGLRPAESLRRVLSDLYADLPGCVCAIATVLTQLTL